MAEIIWTEPALADLDAIADYIALDKPDAAATPPAGQVTGNASAEKTTIDVEAKQKS